MKFVTTLCVASVHLCLITSCITADNFEDILNECYPDIILPQSEIDFLQSLPSHQWKDRVMISKNNVKQAKLVDKLTAENDELKLEQASNLFTCAITRSKSILRWYNKEGMSIMDLPLSSKYAGPPTFYLDLILQQQTYDSDRTKVRDFHKLCKQWHYFLKETKSTHATNVITNLKIYLKHHPEKYNDIEELYTVFCASVARSNRFFNYLSHTFFPSLYNEELGKEENELTKHLFDKMEFYYFGQDDMDFINILFRSKSQTELDDGIKLDNRYLLKHIVVINPNLKFYIIKNARNYQCNDVKKKEVLLPLSDVCPYEEIGTTALIEPFPIQPTIT
ncbi:uncharacterized protein LOC135847764 [Planococcus citri]|uniref:uncharacterized protein LOC135847764 n=1 Tax=Planococcus citri TaxID=170843 RepID=UPI0031F90BDB